MTKFFSSIILCLFIISVSAQSEKIKTIDNDSINSSELSSGIQKILAQQEIPAVSIAVINDGKIVYHEAFGVSNAKTKEPVNKQSIFEAASLSKPIFAYFIMKLVEQGKIDLDKPLYDYLPHPLVLPESADDAKLITARMVLCHQTGFPNHAFNEKFELAFTPGTDFMYSGEAYQYLAAIIGLHYGLDWKKSINELFHKEVAEPLKMDHTSFVWDDYLAAHKVFGHDKEGKPKKNHPVPDYWDGSFQAYSTLHSEAGEYAKFIIAMLKQEGLKTETFSEMLKEQTHFKDDNPLKQQIGQTGWGLGFAQKITEEYTMHMHTGNNHDFQAYTMFVPEKKYGLVVFTNSGKMIPFLMGLSQIIGPQF